jgi:transposase
MTKLFYTVREVAEMLGISISKAYMMIQEWNKELADRGYITISGKVSKKYVDEKIYGYTEEKEAI